jgi:hypothetical protein
MPVNRRYAFGDPARAHRRGSRSLEPATTSGVVDLAHCRRTCHPQVMTADFLRQNPGYRIKGLSCVEPRRLQAYLGRSKA